MEQERGQLLHPRLLAVQDLGDAGREIGQNPVAACAAEGHEAFHHDLLSIEPSALGGAHDHRVFARDLVGIGGRAERVLDLSADIQIGHARFNHNHIRALT